MHHMEMHLTKSTEQHKYLCCKKMISHSMLTSLITLFTVVVQISSTNIARTSCASETVFFISEVNYRLNGVVLKRLEVRDVEECMDECLMNEMCQSINGFEELSTTYHCELLEDERAGNKSFEHKKGWIYYDTGHEQNTMLSSRCQLLPYNPCYPCKCVDSCKEDIDYKCLCFDNLVKDQPYIYISFEKTSKSTETVFNRGSIANGTNKIILKPPTVIKTLSSTGQRVVYFGGPPGGVHLGECDGCYLMYPDYLTISFWAHHPDTMNLIGYFDGNSGEECGPDLRYNNGKFYASIRTSRGFTRVIVSINYAKLKGWRHVVVTYSKDGGKVNVYLDSKFLKSGVQDSHACSSSKPTKYYIGRLGQLAAKSNVSMDDFAIWKRVLTKREIEYIYGLYDIPEF